MANEISINATLKVLKGSLSFTRQIQKSITMTGTHYSAVAQTIGLTAEALTIHSDVGTLGVSWVVNTGDNTARIGVYVGSVFYPVLELRTGEGFPARFADVELYAVCTASAGTVLEHVILED